MVYRITQFYLAHSMHFTVWRTYNATSSNLINTLLENGKKEYFMPNGNQLAPYFLPERILFMSFPIFSFSNIHFNVVYVFLIFFYSWTNHTKILYQFLAYSIQAAYPGHHCLLKFNTISAGIYCLKMKIKFWLITGHNFRMLPESSWFIGVLYFFMLFDIAFPLIWVS
jgi:hypothetical protein